MIIVIYKENYQYFFNFIMRFQNEYEYQILKFFYGLLIKIIVLLHDFLK